jgi:transposase
MVYNADMDKTGEKLEEIKAIKMSPQEQYFLRRYIIRLHLLGKTTSEINVLIGAKTRHINSTIKKYKDGGYEAINLKKKGRPIGKNSILTPEQEEKIKGTIVKNTPDNFKFRGFLWSMKNIMALIVVLYGIKVKRSTLSEYINRWGYTPHRPVIYNKKQNSESVKKWIEEEYPKIKERAEAEDCEIYWCDETGIQNCCNYEIGYAPKGQTPVAKLSPTQKIKVNLVSAINSRGKLHFMMYDEKMNQQRYIVFMGRLIKESDKKVFLISDNLNVHHGEIVKEWCKHNSDKIEMFYIPSYSPDLNPDEYFNGTLKRLVEKEGNIDSKAKLDKTVKDVAEKIQADQRLVANLFNAKSVAYSA